MASISEVGHVKNVANLGAGIQILQEMGNLYNPTNQNITISNLQSVKNSLNTVMQSLNSKIPVYRNAVALREETMAPIGKLSTRVLNYSKSINISEADKENIANLVKKIRGNSQKKLNPETTESNTISTSQMSYDSRIANLSLLSNLVSSHQDYQPNESELSVTNLQDKYNLLNSLSQAVNAAGNELITSRANRNNILYYEQNNVIKLMNEVKAYLKSLGDAGAPYYKAFVKLKFKSTP